MVGALDQGEGSPHGISHSHPPHNEHCSALGASTSATESWRHPVVRLERVLFGHVTGLTPGRVGRTPDSDPAPRLGCSMPWLGVFQHMSAVSECVHEWHPDASEVDVVIRTPTPLAWLGYKQLASVGLSCR